MYNSLRFAAGSIPVTAVTEEDLRNTKDYATPDHARMCINYKYLIGQKLWTVDGNWKSVISMRIHQGKKNILETDRC